MTPHVFTPSPMIVRPRGWWISRRAPARPVVCGGRARRLPHARGLCAGGQRGLSLVEVLVAIAIGAMILVPVGRALDSGVHSQLANRASNDLSQQGRFAIQRIEAAIRLTPSSGTLATKGSDDTSADWLSGSTFIAGGVTYCLRGTQLIEKSPPGTGCSVASNDRTIAHSVSAFSVTQWVPGSTLRSKMIDVSLTLSSGTQSATLASRTRVGGGTL